MCATNATLTPQGAPALDIRIKWPNDIYAGIPNRPPLGTESIATEMSHIRLQEQQQQAMPTFTLPHADSIEGGSGSQASGGVAAAAVETRRFIKIGGALMHTTWTGGGFNLLVGVGLNVTNRQPTTCLQELLEHAMATRSNDTRHISGGTSGGGGGGAGDGSGYSGGGGVGGADCSGGDAAVQSVTPLIRPEVLLARIVSRLDECVQVRACMCLSFTGESEYLALLQCAHCVLIAGCSRQLLQTRRHLSSTDLRL